MDENISGLSCVRFHSMLIIESVFLHMLSFSLSEKAEHLSHEEKHQNLISWSAAVENISYSDL